MKNFHEVTYSVEFISLTSFIYYVIVSQFNILVNLIFMMNDNVILPTIHALWIGEKLGEISNCCLASFVKQGHRVVLHTYTSIKDLPKGVVVSDANKIIPKEKIIRHKQTGSYALFSDIFRYELLKKVDGIYVDCDVYCLKPLIIPEHGYLFGFEDDDKINGAILALPQNSELLNKLIEIAYDDYFIPSWYSVGKQRRLKWQKRLGISKHISDMPWGVIGPEAITYFAKKFKVVELAQEIDVLYPLHYNRISQILTPNLNVSDIVSYRTCCIHLYNEKLRKVDLNSLDLNSILSKMLNNQI